MRLACELRNVIEYLTVEKLCYIVDFTCNDDVCELGVSIERWSLSSPCTMIQQLSLELCFATSFPENTFADIMVDVQERRDAGIFSQRQDILNFSSGLRSAVINDVLDRGMTVRSRSPWLAIAGIDIGWRLHCGSFGSVDALRALLRLSLRSSSGVDAADELLSQLSGDSRRVIEVLEELEVILERLARIRLDHASVLQMPFMRHTLSGTFRV